MHYRMPFVRETPEGQGWEVVTTHLTRRPWPYTVEPFRDPRVWARMRADLYRSSPLMRRAYGACAHLIHEAAGVCRDAGARLVIITVPDPADVRPEKRRELFAHAPDPASCDSDLPDRMIAQMCAQEAIPLLTGRQLLESRHYKAVDPHWSVEGHQRIAEILERVHREGLSGTGGVPTRQISQISVRAG
jgi:hypothetical protein